MKRLVDRKQKTENQCIDIRFFEGHPRSAYLGALFRAIRDVRNGMLRDIETGEEEHPSGLNARDSQL